MGSQSFLPAGIIATAAHAAAARVPGSRGSRRRKKRRATMRSRSASRRTKSRSNSRGKPRPGTKAWMTYIRGLRGKKRKK